MSDPLKTGLEIVVISTLPYINLKPRSLKTPSDMNQILALVLAGIVMSFTVLCFGFLIEPGRLCSVPLFVGWINCGSSDPQGRVVGRSTAVHSECHPVESTKSRFPS